MFSDFYPYICIQETKTIIKNNIMGRVNRSRYNFSKLEIDDTFEIPPIDLLSMKNSLRFYNNKHKKGKGENGTDLPLIKVSTEELSASSIRVTRIA